MARRKVLVLTNAELGQANVFIATIHALLERDPSVEVHVASFPRLEKTMKSALGSVEAGPDGKQTAITFHSLPGRAMFECLNSDKDPSNRIFSVSLLKPGFWHTPASIRFITTKAFLCWSPEEFTAVFNDICGIIEDVAPGAVLVDQIFSPGLTAAKHMKCIVASTYTLAVLSPNSLKDYVHHLEPKAAVFWKWPVVGSGLPMPIPWWLIPLNIYLLLRLIGIMIMDKHIPTTTARVRKLTGLPQLHLTTNISMVNDNLSGIDKVLIGARSEVDFSCLDLAGPPKAYVKKLVGCGPILRPFMEVDRELRAWLRRGAVIYINLGTHCLTSETEAVDMARSLKRLIDAASSRREISGLQILWKLQKDLTRGSDYGTGDGSAIHGILGREMDEDRVRIVEWLTSEPNSILNTGDVVCAVSHGGANSFYEAVCAGVPQVILPSWLDCYDFANRAELLGIGRWGSKQGCPRWIESELAPILIEVVLDQNAEYTARSRVLADICLQNGGGRATAADQILEMLST
ncbi:Fc.00g026520.m01.CDS01 [Cosmosporella sp. VM-42]